MTSTRHHSTTSTSAPNLELRLTLAVGFLGLALAVFAATGSPATNFEPSIYRSTPTLFWAGVAVALVTSLLVSFTTDVPRRLYTAALVLAGASIWAVVALPLLRDYFFYGGGDSLSHLGFARMFADGSMSPVDLLHPGLHLISLSVTWATGLPLGRSMLIATLAFFAIYLTFVPLCVYVITGDRRATAVGLFSALLLLPINNVAIHVVPHPSTDAILFAPFVLFLLFVYLSRSNGYRGPTAVGLLLAIAGTAIVFVHPEQALNVLTIYGVVVVLGVVYRRREPDHPFSKNSPLYVQTAFLALVFLLWAPRSGRTQSRFETLLASMTGAGAPPAGEVSQRAGSLAAVGGSIEELFLKLFFVSLVFSVLAGIVMVTAATGRLDDVFPKRNAFGKYLTAAFVPLVGGTGVIFLASFGDHYFRYIGFLMMLATVLGAAALVRAIPVLASRVPGPTLRKATILLFVLLLPMAVLSIHPSPWIYQGSAQVTEPRYGGYATAFEHRDPDVPYAGIRGGPRRYVEAHYGPTSNATEEFPGIETAVPGAVLERNMTGYYEGPRYVPVSDANVWTEVALYREFRYSWEGFRRLETTPGVDRIQSNSELRVYRVDAQQG